MNKGAAGLFIVMGLVLGGAAYASSAGMGIPQPEKQPVSIREGSTRGPNNSGTNRRYRSVFMYGGFLHGK
jgi:hypothetical protein